MSRPLRISICACNSDWDWTRPKLKEPDPKQLQKVMDMVKAAKCEGAQLALLPETCTLVDLEPATFPQYAQPLDGPTFTKVAETAKQQQIFIAFNHPTLIDEFRYNSTVLFNDTGQIESIYHKAYPVEAELKNGITPGPGAVIAETKFGKIGFATCFDINFADLKAAYRKLKPNLILFPSHFRGGLLIRCWAHEIRTYIVTSIIGQSVIVNPLGRLLKQIDFEKSITHTLNLDYEVFHYDGHIEKLTEIRKEYGKKIIIEPAAPEAVFLLTAADETITAKNIIKEFELETAEEYLDRLNKMADNAAER